MGEGARQRRAENQIVALVQGKPFTYKDAGAKAIEIIERENFLPDTSDQRVKIRVEIAGVRNCTGGQVDLIYRIYSTQILPVLSGRPEARLLDGRNRKPPQAKRPSSRPKRVHFISSRLPGTT